METAAGDVAHEGYTTDIITDLALEWLKERDSRQAVSVDVPAQGAPSQLAARAEVPEQVRRRQTIPEPDTLFDDYRAAARPPRPQKMSIAKDMNPHDLKLVRQNGKFTDEQRAAFEAAYADKNAQFEQAQLEGDALVRWKYQRYVKDYLRCVDSVDENVGRLLDYLDRRPDWPRTPS